MPINLESLHFQPEAQAQVQDLLSGLSRLYNWEHSQERERKQEQIHEQEKVHTPKHERAENRSESDGAKFAQLLSTAQRHGYFRSGDCSSTDTLTVDDLHESVRKTGKAIDAPQSEGTSNDDQLVTRSRLAQWFLSLSGHRSHN
jgi:hypothetical protein